MRESGIACLVARLERYERENILLLQEIREWRELVQHMQDSSRKRHKAFLVISDYNADYLEAVRRLPPEMQRMFWAAVTELTARKEAANGRSGVLQVPEVQGVGRI